MPLEFSVAISPCPNDTFAFYNFFNNNKEFRYHPKFFDIEELNTAMLLGKYDVTKASFPAALKAKDRYDLLMSGAAIGFGVGPILIYSKGEVLGKDEWNIGLPGVNTTANFLWKFYEKNTKKKLPVKINCHYLNFADVMKKTANGELDAGIVIHEGRFVYKDLGLSLFEDLGEFWQNETGFPVPLGGIFIKKEISPEKREKIENDLRESVSGALQSKKNNDDKYVNQILPYIKNYSQELNDRVIENHIEYYVNEDTVNLSENSKKAIDFFMKKINEYK